MSGLRSFLYRLARLLGDYQAARRGRLGERMLRRAAWRAWFRLFRVGGEEKAKTSPVDAARPFL